MKFLYRSFALLGKELCLAKTIGFASVFLSVALLAEPVLFGKVINALTAIPVADRHNALAEIYTLLIAWSCFGLVGVVVSILIGLKADQMAHRQRHVVAKDFYERCLKSTPLSVQGQDSGKLYTIMNEGIDALFWNWLNILRTDLPAAVFLAFLVPLGFAINLEMACTLLVLCFVFMGSTWYVVSKASGLQNAVNQHYQRQSSLCSDVLSNLTLIQAFDGIQSEVARMEENARVILANQYPVLDYWVIVVFVNQCATSISILIIVVQGTRLYAQGRVSVGDIVTFMTFANMVITRLQPKP